MKTAFLIFALLASNAFAALQTVTLSVPTMSCASCPVTVKAALSKVAGVSTVKSDLAKRQTTVVYDDAKTDLAALSRATANAGFPSAPVTASK
ncbi:mercury resistance system periplasmic binding protein MerP [Caenimonas sedimenti]|uniref:Periplasmic mercury ion-binding protein n=1 Tax=Caenimonas sedimenti TaxID=2596921 RepID=A0A562ZHQ4_9BURK|nr:mercury resistance system periplasmic binding protein MerP [Caenimonas sedimenti]TWO68043.1 mercury resistance system periplasmic binding protein MerP [Caenimonas sedimenti]